MAANYETFEQEAVRLADELSPHILPEGQDTYKALLCVLELLNAPDLCNDMNCYAFEHQHYAYECGNDTSSDQTNVTPLNWDDVENNYLEHKEKDDTEEPTETSKTAETCETETSKTSKTRETEEEETSADSIISSTRGEPGTPKPTPSVITISDDDTPSDSTLDECIKQCRMQKKDALQKTKEKRTRKWIQQTAKYPRLSSTFWGSPQRPTPIVVPKECPDSSSVSLDETRGCYTITTLATTTDTITPIRGGWATTPANSETVTFQSAARAIDF